MFVNVWFALKLLSTFVLAKLPVSLSVTKLPLWEPKLLHLVSLLLVYDASVLFLVSCEEVNEFKEAVLEPTAVNFVSTDWVNAFIFVLSQLPDCEPMLENFWSTDAVYTPNVEFLVSC